MDYLDFDLQLSAAPNGYRVRATNAQGAQASATFVLPFAPFEIENLFLRVGRPRRGVRKIESPEMKAAKEFGGKLFDAVFTGEVFALWRSSFNAANAQSKGLRLRLRLSETPELLDLPWEFLYDNARNQFVALLTKTPVVRFLDLSTPIQPLKAQLPLRVLVVIADPSDYDELDVEREWGNVRNATQALETRGAVIVTRLANATLSELRRALRQNEYHILHFIGHGRFEAHEQDGVLIFKNEQGRGQRVSSQMLAQVLVNFDSLRLVILNACEGARTSRNDPFAGIAPSLVQQDKPAVIAMQFEVSDSAAITFADEFYSALAGGYPVDEAVSHARNAIMTDVNDLEWGTPVLYMRAANGVIFDLMNAPPPPKIIETKSIAAEPISSPLPISSNEFARWNRDALEAYLLGDWASAANRFELIIKAQPENQEAAEKLTEAKRQLRLQELRATVKVTLEQGGWGATLGLLEEILALDPDDIEARKNFDEFQQRIVTQNSLSDLYQRGLKAFAAKDWAEAKNCFEKISETDPAYLKTKEFLAKLPPEFRPLPARITNKAGQEMILIPAGEFLMGTSDEEARRLIIEFGKDREKWVKWEQPQHTVSLDAFYISRYPVTNAEYKKFVDATKNKMPGHWQNGKIPNGKENHPVVNVSWDDAIAFCKWLSEQAGDRETGKQVEFRLPTEAQWEKAASWDDAKKIKRVYPWGDSFDKNKCNSSEAGIRDTTPIGKYSPHGDSFYGVGDMAGNVWEWCADWFDGNYYSKSPRENPRNDTQGQFRVLRGGAFDSEASDVRCARRDRDPPVYLNGIIGFRVVLSPVRL